MQDQRNAGGDVGCVVIDLKTRRRARSCPSEPASPLADRQAANAIYAKLADVIERGLPTLSDQSADHPYLERAMIAARTRAANPLCLTDKLRRAGTPQHRDRWEVERERRNVWTQMPRDRRESLLLHALDDERLILRELTSRMNTELGTPDHERYSTVYEGDVRNLVMRMFRAGLLERVEETFRNKPRHRYFRKRGHHDDEAGES